HRGQRRSVHALARGPPPGWRSTRFPVIIQSFPGPAPRCAPGCRQPRTTRRPHAREGRRHRSRLMQFEFTAFPRKEEGRGPSRLLRRGGKAPGIVYGGTVSPEPIELDHNALFHALRNEAFHASILTMKLNGGATKVLLRDVQMHPFKNEILHVDFQ